jgi:hypothetical protein
LTPAQKIFLGGHAMPKSKLRFWHCIAAKFTHALNFFLDGVTKIKFGEKNYLMQKGCQT